MSPVSRSSSLQLRSRPESQGAAFPSLAGPPGGGGRRARVVG